MIHEKTQTFRLWKFVDCNLDASSSLGLHPQIINSPKLVAKILATDTKNADISPYKNWGN